ncbi:TIM21-domain-containing protein [Suhomyces tanzawaensis NRRL Y-17324]|uniref:Mitochondrial import inner membrane translocase subunit Tim21 n=1 Tax=Suhomyces tanzawaensis NRRL Y-17324 TaxID=984487 RepID=A0A1E4SD32_9ASCO|nr:TIM21-domain-containing protein [Suhomyces tanzawaensis NRRL Y-17324]ODV77424.1 TIM21-domain-containing protein [Suhomyces tanzawaensis NRRL Y-17324]
MNRSPSLLLLNSRTFLKPAHNLSIFRAHLQGRPQVLKPLIPYCARYSTKTAPPPPPPPPSDKNAKGKVLLNRITRAFTFSLSSVLVLGAAGVALLVVYLILSELFLPSGDTRTFNKAIKLVEKSKVAQDILGFEQGDRLKAYGETGGDKWVRNRPVHGLRSKGQDGSDHLLMRFHVEADNGKHGSVVLEQVDTSFWSSEFAYIALDVPGSKRAYIIEPKFQSKGYVPKMNGGNGFLGLKWGPKKDE